MDRVTRDDEIVRLYVEEKKDSSEIGAIIGLNPWSVLRILRGRQVETRNHITLTGEQQARMLALRDEGMPALYVAQDLGTSRSVVLRLTPNKEATAEWRRVWGHIRPNPVLRGLHEQFFPRELNS